MHMQNSIVEYAGTVQPFSMAFASSIAISDWLGDSVPE